MFCALADDDTQDGVCVHMLPVKDEAVVRRKTWRNGLCLGLSQGICLKAELLSVVFLSEASRSGLRGLHCFLWMERCVGSRVLVQCTVSCLCSFRVCI